MMKYILSALSLLLSVLTPTFCFAQSLSREDSGPKYLVSPLLSSIADHSAWEHSEVEGKWNKSTSGMLMLGGHYYGMLDNFDSISVYSTQFKDETYSVVTVSSLDGYYKYPSIQEGFTTVTVSHVYLCKAGDFKKALSCTPFSGQVAKVYFRLPHEVHDAKHPSTVDRRI